MSEADKDLMRGKLQRVAMNVSSIRDALHEGLESFEYLTPVALLFWDDISKKFRVCDDNGLLANNRREFKLICAEARDHRLGIQEGTPGPIQGPPSSSLLAAGYASRTSKECKYLLWIVRRLPEIGSHSVISRWLEQGANVLESKLSQTIGKLPQDCDAQTTLRHSAGSVIAQTLQRLLHEQAQRASGESVRYVMKYFLDAVLAVSMTREEGKKASGSLAFVPHLSHVARPPSYVFKFASGARPQLRDSKRVRKLLTVVEGAGEVVVCDFNEVLGIAKARPQSKVLLADFRDGHACLRIGKRKICTISGGRFQAARSGSSLEDLKQIVERRKSAARDLLDDIEQLVKASVKGGHGCTIVLDFNKRPKKIPGEVLEDPIPLTENTCLVSGMACVDGAVHIGREGQVIAFACLLDGKAVENELRARGARYNSALRFTAQEKDCALVVVSEDGPVSVFYKGEQLNAPEKYKREFFPSMKVLTVQEWTKSLRRPRGGR